MAVTPKVLVGLLALGAALFAQGPVGVGNFHRVDERVYRGAQPTPEGFQSLAKLGIKTVIDLRERGFRAQAEKRAVEHAGMRYVNIPFSGFSAPRNDQMAKVLALVSDPAAEPVFIHCRRGADRTGTVVACYRIQHDHWKNRDALVEARGDGMSWLERAMQHYVLSYQPPEAVAAN